MATWELSESDDYAFEIPPVEGMPYDDDSEEARAIDRLIERSETPESVKPSRCGARYHNGYSVQTCLLAKGHRGKCSNGWDR
jgi:hypothetical protein